MRRSSRVGFLSMACASFVASTPALGQSSRGAFIARLGTDTVQIERFEQKGNTIAGTVLQRTPTFRAISWTMTLDANGTPARYEAVATDAARQPMLNGTTGTLEFARDTIVRTAYRNNQAETARIAAPNGAVPSPGLPYVGVTFLSYEWAFDALRRRIATGGDTALYQLTLFAAQPSPAKTRAWIVSSDSAELSYFGVAKSGYRFDRAGRLTSADWRSTTYRYRIERMADANLEPIARAWRDAEQAKRGFGVLSPRDSAKATLGPAHLTIDYSRPAVRGRQIWGTIVPWDAVWRLGADMATHFTTDVDLTIGETLVPAGRYTLWMFPSESAPKLIVSRAVNVFGTNYDPSKDFARIPLARQNGVEAAERLTLSLGDGALAIRWADVAWSVPVVVRN
jgi:hypothetical protein